MPQNCALKQDENGKFYTATTQKRAFQMALVVKNPPADAGDVGWTPGLGSSPGRGHDNPLQYSRLENPMGSEVWWATVHRVSKSPTGMK